MPSKLCFSTQIIQITFPTDNLLHELSQTKLQKIDENVDVFCSPYPTKAYKVIRAREYSVLENIFESEVGGKKVYEQIS